MAPSTSPAPQGTVARIEHARPGPKGYRVALDTWRNGVVVATRRVPGYTTRSRALASAATWNA